MSNSHVGLSGSGAGCGSGWVFGINWEYDSLTVV